jgi:hypothetical protein
MGFFSSRKADDNDPYLTTTGTTTDSNDKSVVHVIRSRFVRSRSRSFQSSGKLMYHGVYVQYGKNKGKEREGQPRTSFTTHGTTVAHTLSVSTTATPAKRGATTTPSPLSGRSRSAGPGILRTQHEPSHISPPSVATHAPTVNPLGTVSAPSSPRPRNHPSLELGSLGAAPAPLRKPTDSVTYVPSLSIHYV